MADTPVKVPEKKHVRFPTFKLVVRTEYPCPMVVVDDINVAAYLWKVCGYEMWDIQKGAREGMRDFYFKVLDPDDLERPAQDVLDFMNNRGKSGRYLDYTNGWKDLKSLLKQF